MRTTFPQISEYGLEKSAVSIVFDGPFVETISNISFRGCNERSTSPDLTVVIFISIKKPENGWSQQKKWGAGSLSLAEM